MKKYLFIATAGLLLAGCTGVRTLSTGLENEAFLEFVGDTKKYADEVAVVVDDNSTFTASVGKEHIDRPKGKVYAISTGKHTISVSYKNQVVYQKQIFVAAQETKKIILP
ncbi:MAG: lipoprotein [Prevotellaceae bacterium]|jgi:hypothetical protein|nr:lipoprotein [Prevotellaceae bacterium]